MGGNIHNTKKTQNLQQFLIRDGEEVNAEKTGDTFCVTSPEFQKIYNTKICNKSFEVIRQFIYWGIIITNQSCFHEEILSRLKSMNAS